MKAKPKNKKQKNSLAEVIMKVMTKSPMLAEEIQPLIKDRFGYRVAVQDVRVNLLYLLRREKIQRQKDNGKYKYFI